MTLDTIDRALNLAIVGLIYGSGAWFAYAFGLSVMSQRRKQQADATTAVSLPVVGSSVEDIDERCPEPSIEIIIEPASIEQSNSNATFVEKLVEQPALNQTKLAKKSVPQETVSSKKTARKTAKPTLKNSDEIQAIQAKAPSKAAKSGAVLPEIICEPVDWKKWKVADLRKASIAKVCGVRTRPIGSKRNLRKVDLIAQYEQQLKRLTKTPKSQTNAEEVA